MSPEPEIECVDAIYDALDRQAPEEAWDLARRGLDLAGGGDPVLHYLGGRALFAMDRVGDAIDQFRAACEGDPDDPEFRAYLAWALFRGCRFDEARAEVERVADDGKLPEPPYVLGLCLERQGRFDDAEAAFREAAARDPEGFPRPVRLTEAEFLDCLDGARRGLTAGFREHLDEVAVLVEPLPSEALLLDQAPPLDPEQLLGLFAGLAKGDEETFSAGGELPPRIHLFQRNLERFAESRDDLVEQIGITLYHELGHYLGMSEEELDESGYG